MTSSEKFHHCILSQGLISQQLANDDLFVHQFTCIYVKSSYVMDKLTNVAIKCILSLDL